jgi:lambda family phage tail tape measure protein
MTAEQRKELMLATEEIQKQRAEIIQQEFDMKRTYSFGAKEYLRDYLNEVTNNANAVRQVFSTTFNSLENTLVDFITTGKMNFRNFATSVISELARIAVRQAVLAPLAGALSSAIAGATTSAASAPATSGSVSSGYNGAASSGQYQFANGGIMTAKGSVPLRKYANGGVANSPQLALFGEGRTPEAYVPLPDGRSIPVNMKGGSGGMNVSVNVNVMKNDNGNSSATSDTQTGKKSRTNNCQRCSN